MPVRAHCPRCKQPLSVPNKLAGSYASCPRCQGRFWVSKDAPLDPPAGESGSMPATGTLTLKQVPAATPGLPLSARMGPPPVSAGAANAAPRTFFPSVTPAAPTPLPSPPVDGTAGDPPAAPPRARKVARLISAEAAQSTLKLAADGQLPQLRLQEDDKQAKGKGKSRSIPPMVLIVAWIFSVGLTVAIVIATNDNGTEGVTTQAKKDAMAAIENNVAFFGDPARGELLPYQRWLREARQARARGDAKAERHYYKQVLDLLHTEAWSASSQVSRDRLEKGVTGSRDDDRKLEDLIFTVMEE